MAHILYLEWNSYAGLFMTRAWKKNGDTFVSFLMDTRENTRYGEELTRKLVMTLMSEKFDYVFSFNFFPVAAMAAKACRLPYVSWVYDNPYALLYSQTIRFETNYCFLFDRAQVQRLRKQGVQTVYYLPLASDVEYYDSLPGLSEEKRQAYRSDISFVGSLYIEERQQLYRRFDALDAYTKGYLDGMVELQSKLYGLNVLEDMLTPKLISKMEQAAPLMEHPDAFATKAWYYANFYLYRQVTALERTGLLGKLSDYDLKVYTSREAKEKLQWPGMYDKVDYYEQAPYVYQNSKININITLKSIETGIPLRIFDIMANGGFVLTNYQADLFELFTPGEDFVYYEDEKDFLCKIDYYLSHDKERQRIAQNARKKIEACHTFYDRLQDIHAIIFRDGNRKPDDSL